MPKTKQDRADLKCKTSSFRRQDIPGTASSGSIKVSTAYISAAEIVDKLDFDPWMEVNPRVPKRSKKNVLTGAVVKGISTTLAECPEHFALKNMGLFVLAKEVDQDRGSDDLTIVLTKPKQHGLCNGGHTYAVLRDYADRGKGAFEAAKAEAALEDPNKEKVQQLRSTATEIRKNLETAFVRVQILEGVNADQAVEIAEGLNRSRQVDQSEIDDLKNHFDKIKKAMEGEPGEHEIGYHSGQQNQNGVERHYGVSEIIRYLMFFDTDRYQGGKHPSDLYRYKTKTLNMFREAIQLEDSVMHVICDNAPKILKLWHLVARALPDAGGDGSRRYRRMEVRPRRKNGQAITAASGSTFLHFLGDGHSVDAIILNGWVMPMVAAFRANAEIADGKFEWKHDPEDILPDVINDFYRICAEAKDNGRKPDDIGRDASIYGQMYDKVENVLLRKEVELLRAASK